MVINLFCNDEMLSFKILLQYSITRDFFGALTISSGSSTYGKAMIVLGHHGLYKLAQQYLLLQSYRRQFSDGDFGFESNGAKISKIIEHGLIEEFPRKSRRVDDVQVHVVLDESVLWIHATDEGVIIDELPKVVLTFGFHGFAKIFQTE